MTFPARLLGVAILLLVAAPALALTAESADRRPRVFWASDPVRPKETVLVQGSDLGATAIVELARLEDGPTLAAQDDVSAPAEAQLAGIKTWTRVPALQANDESLKFTVPADWKPGVFVCRIVAEGGTSAPVLLNEPDPWWIQGDEGQAATPGGWLRVLGKSLSGVGAEVKLGSAARLLPEQGPAIDLQPSAADGYSLRFDLPRETPLGKYTVEVHNGSGAGAAWRAAGSFTIVPAPSIPAAVFSVLDFYGPDARAQMRKSLVKYNQPIDRTEGIRAALKKAAENGGGTVYFPAGRYTIQGPLVVPDRTLLKGEGMGLVTLWWGVGPFNLDGGGPQGRKRSDQPPAPDILIFGRDYGVEDLSIYLPLDYRQGLVADDRFRMRRVRIRVDHAWLLEGRGEGTVARMGRNFQVADCDIFAKGQALVSGQYGVIAKNRVLSMKTNTPLGGALGVIVEDNHFVSMDPTAYQNIAGCGRNLYYAHNHQESLFAHQADYSFTFDASAGAYLGAIAEAKGTRITLAGDPSFPQWAPATSSLWRRSVVCILSGRGTGQWRDVVSNDGKVWEIERSFDTAPDSSSVATIVPFNGRVLIIGNRFEDAAWVNAGYGTSIDVVCAENELLRSALLLNYGVHADDWFEPSWYVQYFDNRVREGQTGVETNGGGRKPERYPGPLTRWAVHRRHTIAADNSGSISIAGNFRDAIVEGCKLNHPLSYIKVDGAAEGVFVRANEFAGEPAPRYAGEGIQKALAPLAD